MSQLIWLGTRQQHLGSERHYVLYPLFFHLSFHYSRLPFIQNGRL